MPATITRTSMLTGITRTLQVKQYDHDEFEKRLLAWRNGNLLLEEAFADLSPNARQFIKNGTTEEEWEYYASEAYKPII
jgi:hypothetical protein